MQMVKALANRIMQNIDPLKVLVIPNVDGEVADINDICQNRDDNTDEEVITNYLKDLEFPSGMLVVN